MKHFLLDANVVLDYLIERKPYSLTAAKLFNYAEKGKVKIYVSAVSYTNIFYVVRKFLEPSKRIALLLDLEEMTETVDVTQSIIKSSLQSNFSDFEDAVQYHCAVSNKKIDAIVTRNEKDFKKSSISILSPEEALGLIASL